MPRVGKFTGKIYSDDYVFSHCPECCTIVSEKEINDLDFMQNLRQKDILHCLACHGCPESHMSESYQGMSRNY